MPFLDSARGPDDTRLYAIGDIHGRLDLLRDMHGRIARDLVARPCPKFRVIHLGDLIDRGPDSAGVIAHLLEFCRDGDAVCLAGNHDIFMRAFLKEGDSRAAAWLSMGGDATVASYGLQPDISFKPRGLRELRRALAKAVPDSHKAFLDSLPFHERHGDFVFVHAGIKPGKPLKKQKVYDVTTIRDVFLDDTRDHGFVVVHGHTPCDQPEIRPNRINLDTRAYASGVLTCLTIDGGALGFLEPEGHVPLTPPK